MSFQFLTRRVVKLSGRIPLRLILVVPFVIQISGIVAIVQWLSARNSEKVVSALTYQLQSEVTGRVTQTLNQYLQLPHQINQLNIDALKAGLLTPPDLDQFQRYFWRQMQQFPNLSMIYYANEQGDFIGIGRQENGELYFLVTDSTTAGAGHIFNLDKNGDRTDFVKVSAPKYDPRVRSWYINAAILSKPMWSEIYSLFEAPKLIISANQAYQESSQLVGVFGADLILEDIGKFLNTLQVGKTGETYIIERSGFLVASSTPEIPFLVDSKTQQISRLKAADSTQGLIRDSSRELIKKFGSFNTIKQPEFFTFKTANGAGRFLQVTPLKDERGIDWLIVVVIPEEDFIGVINDQVHITIILGFLALLIAIIIGWWTSHWITKPILKLSEASTDLAQGQWNRQVPKGVSFEVSNLAKSFEIMAEQLLDNSLLLEQQVIQKTQELQQEICDRQLLEEKLRSSEAEMRRFFETMTDVILLINPQTQEIKIAPTNPNRLYPEEIEILQLTLNQFEGDSETLFHQQIQQAIDSQTIIEFEYSLSVGDRKIWFIASIIPALPSSVAWVARDITNAKRLEEIRQQAETALRKSEATNRALLNAIPDLLMTINREGVYLGLISPMNLAYSQRVIEVKPGQTLSETLPPEIAQTRLEYIHQSLDTGEIQFHEYQITIQDQIYYEESRIVPISDHEALVMVRDITNRKKTELALKISEEKFSKVFRSSPDLITLSTLKDGRYVDVNDSFIRAIGYTREEIIGKTSLELGIWVSSEQRNSFIKKLRDQESVKSREVELWSKQGEKITALMSAEVIDVNQEKCVLAVLADITERKRAEEALRIEQEKSEQLLLNILPQAIANQLKQNQQAIAQHFDEVSILFADIVNFTPLSAKLAPIPLVNLLNQVFSKFDQLTQEYKLEKIKTIGDAYMVVGGLPTPRIGHLEGIADMALRMQTAIQNLESQLETPFQIRIGINIGPVVAGVIGMNKFSYDLWGDAVNIASRMESSGIPGKIQVTEAVYQQLNHQYQFTERGLVEVKGRGKMMTYWLIGKQAEGEVNSLPH